MSFPVRNSEGMDTQLNGAKKTTVKTQRLPKNAKQNVFDPPTYNKCDRGSVRTVQKLLSTAGWSLSEIKKNLLSQHVQLILRKNGESSTFSTKNEWILGGFLTSLDHCKTNQNIKKCVFLSFYILTTFESQSGLGQPLIMTAEIEGRC